MSTTLSSTIDRASLGRSDAEQGEPDIGSAGADEPGEPDHLTGPHFEIHIFERAGTAEPLDPQHRVAGHVAGAHEEVADVPTDHLADEKLAIGLGREAGGDVPAVVEHGDSVGDAEHLVEPVADEQHGDATAAQPVHLVEQSVDLMGRQRGGRLVHDQHPGVERDRLGDLHRLLGADRQRVRRRPGIDVDVE